MGWGRYRHQSGRGVIEGIRDMRTGTRGDIKTEVVEGVGTSGDIEMEMVEGVGSPDLGHGVNRRIWDMRVFSRKCWSSKLTRNDGVYNLSIGKMKLTDRVGKRNL